MADSKLPKQLKHELKSFRDDLTVIRQIIENLNHIEDKINEIIDYLKSKEIKGGTE